MLTIEDIKKKYERAILKTQNLYDHRKEEDTAGSVRYTKGNIVEEITKDLIQIAWGKISSDKKRLKMNKQKIAIKTNGEVYKLSQDIHVFIDDKFKIGIECKSYTEVAMYKRVLLDASLLKNHFPTTSCFFIVQLENFLGGDYGANLEPKGSESVITLDRLFPDLNIKVITLLDGDRGIKKPIHIKKYFKPLTNARIEYAIEQFKKALSQDTKIREPGTTYTTIDINKERKVINREEKEIARGGTKYLKSIKNGVEVAISDEKVNRIICGDSENVLKNYPSNSIDIVVTSPPYNFGLDYKNDQNKDAIYWQDYFNKLNKVWSECFRVLKPGGRICVNIQPLFSDYMPTHHIISNQLMDLGLLWKGEILWDKHNYNCKYTAWGSWQSPSMPYLKYTWEFIDIFCKESHKKNGDSKNIDITGDEFKKWVYAKWDIAPERNMKEFDHPAMFPEELVIRLLKLFSFKGDVVLDPFNGAGTTTVIAYKLNRKYIGIDVSKEYCRVAEERIKDARLPLLTDEKI